MDDDEQILNLYNFIPWQPMTNPKETLPLIKMNEECGELVTASSRCLNQGIDEKDPETLVVNRRWLENEMADVLSSIELNIDKFGLDLEYITTRKNLKKSFLLLMFS